MLSSPIPQASCPTLVGAFMGMIQNQIQMTHAKTPTQTQLNPNSGNITPTSHLIEVGDDDEDVCTDVLDSLWTNAGLKKRSTSAPAGLGGKPDKNKKKGGQKIGTKADIKQKSIDSAEKVLLEYKQLARALSHHLSMMSVTTARVEKVAKSIDLMLSPELTQIYSSEYHDPAFNNHVSPPYPSPPTHIM